MPFILANSVARAIAFFIDCMLFFIAGKLVSSFYPLEDGKSFIYTASICLLALFYFMTMSSSVGHGQTLGKRFMKIRLVDSKGNFLKPSQSVLHYAILVPVFVQVSRFPAVIESPYANFLVAWLFVGFFVCTWYLLLFGQAYSQLFHDFLSKTYVVTFAVDPEKKPVPPIPKFHWFILLAIFCGLGLLTVANSYL